MKNLILIIGWGIGIFTVDYKKDSAVKEVNEAKIAKYQDSLAVIRKSRIIELSGKSKQLPCDPCPEHLPCPDCPIHKDKPCPPIPECDTTGLKVFGYDIKGDLVYVRTNKGIGETKLKHDIKVK